MATTPPKELKPDEAFAIFKSAPGPARFAGTLGTARFDRLWSEWTTACDTLSLLENKELEGLLERVSTIAYGGSNQNARERQDLSPEQADDLVDKGFWLNRMLFDVPFYEAWRPGMYRYGLSLMTMHGGPLNTLYPFAMRADNQLTLTTTEFSYAWFGPPPYPVLEFRQFEKLYSRRGTASSRRATK